MSDEELRAGLRCSGRNADRIAREPEPLGEFTVEVAAQMGTFFENPADEAVVESLLEARARERRGVAGSQAGG